MSSELIINSAPGGVRIALLENKRLVEYHVEEANKQYCVGDIYLGIVSKILPGLNAAFIDVGSEKMGFLHYLDLSPQFNSLNKFVKNILSKRQKTAFLDEFSLEKDIEKTGKISNTIQRNQPILVQILKEPISTKGPRLCSEISIPGRYIVMLPFTNTVSISKKIINSDERNRLRQLIYSIKPKNFGIIVRTLAEDKPATDIENDMKMLVQKWQECFSKLSNSKPREKILGELNRASSILRDMLNENFDNIYVDSDLIYEDLQRYISSISQDKNKILKLYTGKAKIFEYFGIEKQLKASFGKSVTIPSGGYILIEHTEAMHVIDVNSGNKANVENDQDTTAMSVNSEAAKEIARQLRLRDIGGIIIIDFIDMRSMNYKRDLFQIMFQELRNDKTKSKVLPLSKFGLMQITRQRSRPETFIKTAEVCPSCNGTGAILPTILITDDIENNLNYLLKEQNEKKLTLIVHPYLHAFFTKGIISRQMKWFFNHLRWVKIVKDSSFPISQYTFLNSNGEEIELTS